MNISNLTVVELKSLAYDTISEVEVMQKNLNVINNEIAKKVEAERMKAKQETENVRGVAGVAKAKEDKPTKDK